MLIPTLTKLTEDNQKYDEKRVNEADDKKRLRQKPQNGNMIPQEKFVFIQEYCEYINKYCSNSKRKFWNII